MEIVHEYARFDTSTSCDTRAQVLRLERLGTVKRLQETVIVCESLFYLYIIYSIYTRARVCDVTRCDVMSCDVM